MKFIITESQFKLLNEQPDSKMPWSLEKSGYNPSKPETFGPALEKQQKLIREADPHTILMVGQLATAFIPVIGPFVSAGLGFLDAAVYLDKGDNKNAGLAALFASLPLIGSLVNKIPIIKKLGENGMKILSDKLIKFGNKAKLEPQEFELLSKLSQEKSLVTQELNQYSKELANQALKTTTKNSLKPTLKKIAVGGLKFAGTIGAYVATEKAYGKTWDYVHRDAPRTKVETENYDWGFIKTAFGSSGSAYDNKLLNQAWDSGWRPGQLVPKQYRTKAYQEELDIENEGAAQLKKLTSKYN